MITRIEIDGFKSFRNFAVNLRPFQVLVGPNGAGKSNLFDAIVLLGQIAGDNTLHEAFRQGRGDIGELFSLLPDGQRVREMRFAVEMLIGQQVTDELGVTVEIKHNRLRYELGIERRREGEFERLYVTAESLIGIKGDDDAWMRGNLSSTVRSDAIVRSKGRRTPYLSTEDGIINIHQDQRSGQKRETPLGRVERSVLSTISSGVYPTAYAVRQEMLNWQFLQFNPMALREAASVYARSNKLMPDGSNLAAVLYRLANSQEFVLNDISRTMANLVNGIQKIDVEPLYEREEFKIKVKTADGWFSSEVVSDGTLRLLALVTLSYDPLHQGVLCFEEPENGVHPQGLQRLVERVLHELVTDFSEPPHDDEPLNQLLLNTHSPYLLSYVDPKDILYVFMPASNRLTTQIASVSAELFDDPELQQYTLMHVKRMLEAESLDEQQARLSEQGQAS
jgi:predicted ATPase